MSWNFDDFQDRCWKLYRKVRPILFSGNSSFFPVWKSKLNINSLMTVSIIIINCFRFVTQQHFNETPLICWIIIEDSGEICCAHCNCMAGLGETCTHISAVLFYLEALYRLKGTETCTQQRCEWIMPKFQRDMDYLPIEDIDFTPAIHKKRKLDEAIENNNLPVISSSSKQDPVCEVST